MNYKRFLLAICKNPRVWFNLWYEGDFHFSLIFNGWVPQLCIQFHDDFCTDKDFQLVLLRNQVPPEEFVFRALKATKGCRFIIFEASPEEFIQFWVQHNQCILSYPLLKGNKHKQYMEKFLSILTEMSIKQLTIPKGYDPAPNHFAIEKTNKMIDYRVNFGQISPRVAEFTNRMFLEAFEDELINVRAKVG